MSRPWRARGRPDPNPAASMVLLQEVLDRPLDPGYLSAADDRRAAGLPPSTGSRSLLLLLAAVVVGFLLTVSAQVLRTPDPAAAEARAELVDRVRETRELAEERAARLAALEEAIVELQQPVVGTDTGLGERLRAASALAGGTPVVGPGISLTLDDPPRLDEGATPGEERVLARDLQVVVNGLWANRAEAVAINGHRLTSTSSIRFAGEAIIVDFTGLTRPYTVSAVGPPEGLEAELSSGDTGAYLQELRTDYGIIVEVTVEDELTLPAATRLSVREAEVPGGVQR